MFKSRCALLLVAGLVLAAGAPALLADPGKGKGKGEFPAAPTHQMGKGGHGWPGDAPQGQMPRNGKGKPAQAGGPGHASQWGGFEDGQGKGRGGMGREDDIRPGPGSRQPWPEGHGGYAGRDAAPDWGGFGERDREHIRRVIGDNRGYWGSGQSLPPGIRKNLQRGKPLPPGIARQHLDSRLESRLPRFPGFEWARVGPDLVQLSTSTGVVNQVLSGMFE